MNDTANPIRTKNHSAEGESTVADGRRERHPRRRPSWTRRLITVAMGLLIGGFVGVLWVAMFGRVQGTEFSAGTLTQRRFSYYEIPILRWQITPISRRSFAGSLEQRLLNDKLVAIQPDQRWDLVQASRWNERIAPHGAGILLDYLEARLDYRDAIRTQPATRHFWDAWTDEHPSLAAVLWPEVIELARRQLYPFVPDIMVLARQASAHSQSASPGTSGPADTTEQATALRTAIARQSQNRCREMADLHEELGNPESARQFRAWGDEYGEKARESRPEFPRDAIGDEQQVQEVQEEQEEP